jgi:hypothetical protein
MTKPIAFPKCGTCDLGLPDDDKNSNTLWCHGAPPSAIHELVVVMVENQPVQEKRRSSIWPPVHKDKPGCALHPQVRRKL